MARPVVGLFFPQRPVLRLDTHGYSPAVVHQIARSSHERVDGSLDARRDGRSEIFAAIVHHRECRRRAEADDDERRTVLCDAADRTRNQIGAEFRGPRRSYGHELLARGRQEFRPAPEVARGQPG